MADAMWWLIVAIVCVILEIAHRAFYAVFLAVGALVAALAGSLGAPFAVQIPVFAVAAVGGLWAVRPFLVRAMSRGHYRLVSGAQGLVGKEAIVTERVGDLRSPGRIRVQGESWRALSSDGSPIEPGDVVLILDLDGSTFIVQKMPDVEHGLLELPKDDL